MSNDPPPSDDFGATSFERSAFELDEETGELIPTPATTPAAPTPATPTPPAPQPRQERRVVGPAWAGTLPGTDRAPTPRPAAPAPYVPPPVEAPLPPAVPAAPVEDPADFAATSLHQRVHPVSAEPPIDHLKTLEELGHKRGSSVVTGPKIGDTTLKVSLAVVVVVIGLLLVALFVGLIVEFAPDDEAETMDVQE